MTRQSNTQSKKLKKFCFFFVFFGVLVVFFCFSCFFWCFSGLVSFSAVALALIMCALVTSIAAYANTVALARATAAVAFVAFVALAMHTWWTIAAAIIWPECATIRLRVLFEQQHVLMQCAKLAANLCDDWLNE
jgi:hypothetical protein